MNDTSYSRYLEAKKPIDDRSINHKVWTSFLSRLALVNKEDVLTILEIGAGTGNTLISVIENCSHQRIVYTVVDIQSAHIETLIENLEHWAVSAGKNVIQEDNILKISSNGRQIQVLTIVGDINEYVGIHAVNRQFYAVIGQAVLDLLDIQALLPVLREKVVHKGLLYFPINFDGLSAFLPYYDREIDDLVTSIYHESMQRNGVDRSQTGRQVLLYCIQAGIPILNAGSSDWIVRPDHEGKYPGDEQYFLEHILYFVKNELAKSDRIDAQVVEAWSAFREKQIQDGELVYIAHQLDVLASNG